MRAKSLLWTMTIAVTCVIAVLTQGRGQPADPRRTPGVQGGRDPMRAAFVMANCKNPAAATGPARAGGPAAPGGAGAARGPAAPATPAPDLDYTVEAIPGVIAAGQRWKALWEDTGNNADGIVGLDDGSLLIAQNDKSDVVKIDKNGKASVVYTDTYTGGSLAANGKGQLFIAERALPRSIWLLEPERRLFAELKDGEPLECLGTTVLNDLSADNKGGVYMTMGGVYYANPQGKVMGRFGTVLGNGLILSPDDKTLYVTGQVGGGTPTVPPGGGGAEIIGLVAFDVQPDGSLTNERQFTSEVCGDGSAVDAEGRIYCSGNGNMIAVVDKTGKTIGRIPAPRRMGSIAFGGPNKKTLFITGGAHLLSIQMIAQGYKKRPK